MRCDYCYNKEIVFAKNGSITMGEALDFLRSRSGLLDGVVLSGGEATAYDLREFCHAIKALGFSIKLDTNGTNFTNIKKLLDLELLDYVALDYKAPKAKFTQISHSNKYDAFLQTLEYLLAGKTEFEVRTTLHADLLDVDDINAIIEDLEQRGYKNNYYIQEFLDTQESIANLQKPTKKFDKSKLKSTLNVIWR
jgi:pyruvate formate lyase activating enzyme